MTVASTPPAPLLRRESSALVRLRRLGSILADVLRNPTTAIGAAIIVAMLAMAALAPLLVDANPLGTYQMPREFTAVHLPPGTDGHLLGTTSLGGDMLYGIVWGSRLSLLLSFVVVGAATLIGLLVGSIAGMAGGKVDGILMRIADVFLSVPELIFPLTIAAVLGPSFSNIMLALAVVIWPRYARIARSRIIQVRQEGYVNAARSIGDSRFNIVRRDILPNSMTPIAVQATLDMGHVVLLGATLSFLGLSQAGLAEWGRLVSVGQEGITAGWWWTSTFAGLMIFLWALAFSLVGDGLRDVLDPRTEGR
ncbi:MAG: ABC transporter permease [Actinomycetia bacterium]|nr:ABC transporter permease [Actinomycetes bacterium]